MGDEGKGVEGGEGGREKEVKIERGARRCCLGPDKEVTADIYFCINHTATVHKEELTGKGETVKQTRERERERERDRERDTKHC